MSDEEVFGPIDFVLLEFPASDKLDGSMAEEIMRLVDAGTIRLYDVVVIKKEDDGSYSGIELEDVDADSIGGLTVFAGARSGLVGEDDKAEAAAAMEPGTVAALLVYENAWAVPFVAAARRAGGQMIASARLSAQDVMDALDALED